MRFSSTISIFFLFGFSSFGLTQTCNDALEQTAFSARFEIDPATPELAKDTATGLTWQRCRVGFVYSNNDGNADTSKHTCTTPAVNLDEETDNNLPTTFNWVNALAEAKKQSEGWRVPNIKELSSILEMGCSSPALNTQIFPNTLSSLHWTSTPNASTAFEAWALNFSNADDDSTQKFTLLGVLLVKD